MDMWQEMKIEGRTCFIRQQGNAGPVIYQGIFIHQEDEKYQQLDHMWNSIREEMPQQEFVLVAFTAGDWNRDFSPWEAPAVFKDSGFEGKGKETLRWLTFSCIPYINEHYGAERPRILAGYSLAGLFALWAAYETDLFEGIACCSGSLWFPKWDTYVNTYTIKRKCDIYLSLGTKEEKTRNPVMAMVGDRTRVQIELLEKDSHVGHATLEWNQGGHFADSGMRVAKGLAWLMHLKS